MLAQTFHHFYLCSEWKKREMPSYKNVIFEKEKVLFKYNFKISFRQYLLAYLSASSLDVELFEEGNFFFCLVHSSSLVLACSISSRNV